MTEQDESSNSQPGSRPPQTDADSFEFDVQPQPRRQPASEPRAGQKPPPPPEEQAAYEPPPRRPSAQRDSSFNALAWLLEGIAGFTDELQHNDLGLPQEFWIHAYAARRECLLATRAVIDHLLVCAEGGRDAADPRRTQRGAVKIQFE